MTNTELIKLLLSFPPNTRVVVTGYEESGVDDIASPLLVHLRLNAHSEFYLGKHEIVDPVFEQFDEPAIYIN